MPRVGEPLPPDVRALLAAAMRPLGVQLAAARSRPGGPELAAAVVAPGADWPAALEAAPHRTPAGVRCAVVPRDRVAAVVGETAPSIGVAFLEQLAPGEVWCLAIWREGDRDQVMLVPVSPSVRAPGRGSA